MDEQQRKEEKELQKQAFKEAFHDLMAEVGIWSIKGIGVMFASVLIYLFMTSQGWHK